ncbi:MAG: hypothetical protein ACR2KV_04545 [Solirubrobacteraceae bacterium]
MTSAATARPRPDGSTARRRDPAPSLPLERQAATTRANLAAAELRRRRRAPA